MRRFLHYSNSRDDQPPTIAIYRVFGVQVHIDNALADVDQALADAFGMTKADFLAAEATWDDLKTRYQAALTQIVDDDAARAADLLALPGMTQVQVAAAFGRALAREGRGYDRETKLLKFLAQLWRNDERPEPV